jgi:hypothetical protein
MVADMPVDCSHAIEQLKPLPNLRHIPPKDLVEWAKRFDAASECTRLAEAGWRTIATVAAEGRSVRRVTFNEPRLSFRIPAVALEKSRGGAVIISISIDKPRRRFSARLPPEAWSELDRRLAEFRKPTPPPAAPLPPAPPPKGMERFVIDVRPPIHLCHGWSGVIETAEAGTSSRAKFHECNGGAEIARLGYAYALANLAVQHVSECAPARAKLAHENPGVLKSPEAPVWVLIDCGGRLEPRTFDDP